MDIVKQFCWELDADEILAGVLCDSGVGNDKNVENFVTHGEKMVKNNFTVLGNDPLDECLGIPGCPYIYIPAPRAREYTPLAANSYKGCGHHCTYCYMTTRMNPAKTEIFPAGAVPRKNYLENLRKDAVKYQAAGITEQVLLSFSTDAYNPFDTSLTRPTIQIIQEHGMAVSILTKGGSRSLADIDLFRANRDCYAATCAIWSRKSSRLLLRPCFSKLACDANVC